MGKDKNNIWAILAMFFFLLTALFFFIGVWQASTDRVTVRFDCQVNEFIPWTVGPDEDCIMYAIDGEMQNVCLVPKDVHCTGALEDAPIVRGVVEAIMQDG